MLNFSSKFKEKDLCDPLEAYPYFKASPYFYTLLNPMALLLGNNSNSNNSMITLTTDELASYKLSQVICKIPKRQLITDADLLSQQVNILSLANYVSILLV